MKIEVWILLLPVLTAILVCNHCCDCRPKGEVETQIPVTNTVNPVHRRNACYKGCSYGDVPICGHTLVVTTPVKREINNDSLNDYEEDDPHLDKVLGGSYATYGEIPWMATILYNYLPICGGSIISEFWVISSAHCFFNRYERLFKIAVGDHRLWYRDDYEVYFVPEKIIIHKDYRPKEGGFDIALVKVKAKTTGRGIRFNDYVQPICLAYAIEGPALGTQMLVAGWGFTTDNPDHGQSKLLKKTTLPVISMDTCRRLYANDTLTSPNLFCAGYVRGDTSLCKGDSGGGAASKLGENYILYGIAESGSACRAPNYPMMFESVPKLRAWIDNTISINSKDNEKVMPVRQIYIDFVPLPDNLPNN